MLDQLALQRSDGSAKRYILSVARLQANGKVAGQSDEHANQRYGHATDAVVEVRPLRAACTA